MHALSPRCMRLDFIYLVIHVVATEAGRCFDRIMWYRMLAYSLTPRVAFLFWVLLVAVRRHSCIDMYNYYSYRNRPVLLEVIARSLRGSL